jgi:hypothetical protein
VHGWLQYTQLPLQCMFLDVVKAGNSAQYRHMNGRITAASIVRHYAASCICCRMVAVAVLSKSTSPQYIWLQLPCLYAVRISMPYTAVPCCHCNFLPCQVSSSSS